jgi:hypothetical protein
MGLMRTGWVVGDVSNIETPVGTEGAKGKGKVRLQCAYLASEQKGVSGTHFGVHPLGDWFRGCGSQARFTPGYCP